MEQTNPATLMAALPSVTWVRAPDPAFADPRLARLYDVLDGDRSDLDVYLAIANEVAAARVIDVGCGTGSLALLLAATGLDVVGVDPAVASLEVARAKPGAKRVRWVAGDATDLVPLDLRADLALMTGNVAQVFVDDADWSDTLRAVHDSLRPEGWFVFETRRPEARDWQRWDLTPTTIRLPSGSVVFSRTVTAVTLPLVTFVSTTVVDGEELASTSTLRFREQAEVEVDLDRHGFEVVDVREAPDRPGKELVFLAQRRRPTRAS